MPSFSPDIVRYSCAVHPLLGRLFEGSFVVFHRATAVVMARGTCTEVDVDGSQDIVDESDDEVAVILELFDLHGSQRMRVGWLFSPREAGRALSRSSGCLAHERFLSPREGRYELAEVARTVTAVASLRVYQRLIEAACQRGCSVAASFTPLTHEKSAASPPLNRYSVASLLPTVAGVSVPVNGKKRIHVDSTTGTDDDGGGTLRLLAEGGAVRFSHAHGYFYFARIFLVRAFYDDRLRLLMSVRSALRLCGVAAATLAAAVRCSGGVDADEVEALPPSRLMPGKFAESASNASSDCLVAQRALFERAWQALQLSVIVSPLPCREQERVTLCEHMAPKISEGSSGVFYVCGPPGTGKTALMSEIVRLLHSRSALSAADAEASNRVCSDAPPHPLLAHVPTAGGAAAAAVAAFSSPLPPFRSAYINALSLTACEFVYSALAQAVGISRRPGSGDDPPPAPLVTIGTEADADTYMPPTQAVDALETYFSSGAATAGGSSQRPVHVVIVDEVDCLLSCASANQIVYNLFNWAQLPRAGFILICIGNTNSLPDRLEPKLASRVAQARVELHGYSRRNLAEIARVRLAVAGLTPEATAQVSANATPIFDEGALHLASMNQSGEAGDVRRSMNALQVAVGLALRRLEGEVASGRAPVPATGAALVTLADVREARASLDRRALAHTSPWQRLLLIAAAIAQTAAPAGAARVYQFSIEELHERLLSLLPATGVFHAPVPTAYGSGALIAVPRSLSRTYDEAIVAAWPQDRSNADDRSEIEIAAARALREAAAAAAAAAGVVSVRQGAGGLPAPGVRIAVWGAGAASALFLPAAGPAMYERAPTLDELAGAAEGLGLAGLVLLEPSHERRLPLLRLRVAVDDVREVYVRSGDPLAERVLAGAAL